MNKAASLTKFVSTTFYFPENSGESSYESYYNHPGVAITAAAGDNGYGPVYPASSRYVTAVGGTTLTRATNARGWSETAWTYGGSGCSAYLTQPVFQDTYTTGCSRRATADVAADADPATGVAVYQTYGNTGRVVEGGTGIAANIVLGVYALAGNPAAADTPNFYPYAAATGALNDITTGSNGTCSPTTMLCQARPQWDGPTGLGTPNGITAFKASHAVLLKNPGPQTTNYATPVSLQLQAWDSQAGGSVSYVTSGLPPGLTIGTGGLISGTPTCTTTIHTYSVTASATEGTAGDTITFTWTINSHPTCP